MDKCTVLINSCDSFSDVWELFFKSFKINWPDCKFPIVLNTESKIYKNDINVKTINFTHGFFNNSWGKRLKSVLRQIKTPYIIPILDDFVLRNIFKGNNLIEQCIDWLEKNDNIGAFYLHRHPNVINKSTEFYRFGKMPDKCEYKLTTAFGVWRKDFLYKTILGIESPWEWEVNRTKRAWRYKEKIYALLEDDPPLFDFPFGGVIWRGLWHTEAIDLAKKYNVQIDFTVRGMMDVNDPYRLKLEKEYSVVKNFPKDIFKLVFWKELFNRIKTRIRKGFLEIC